MFLFDSDQIIRDLLLFWNLDSDFRDCAVERHLTKLIHSSWNIAKIVLPLIFFAEFVLPLISHRVFRLVRADAMFHSMQYDYMRDKRHIAKLHVFWSIINIWSAIYCSFYYLTTVRHISKQRYIVWHWMGCIIVTCCHGYRQWFTRGSKQKPAIDWRASLNALDMKPGVYFSH